MSTKMILLIWRALKECGLDYVGAFECPLMRIAMPVLTEHGSIQD